MSSSFTMTRARQHDAECSPAVSVTRSLLGYGVMAGPVYVISVLAQGLTREGFDLTRDDASLLSNGDLGWIQVVTFLITGAMVLAFSVGAARARAGRWVPALVGVYGLGLIGAGLFVADPMNGFPPGTPMGHSASVSLHGVLHIISAAVGFLSLIAACLVMARRCAAEAQRGWATSSVLTAVLFLGGFVGVASGSGSPLVILGFWVGLIAAWTWLAALAVHLYREVSSGAC